MTRAVPTLIVGLLMFGSNACVAAQAEQARQGSSVTPAPVSPEPARRPVVNTGLEIAFPVSVDASGVATPAHPFVRVVRPDSPGERAGFLAGDVILAVDGRDSREDRALWLQADMRYTLRIRRGDEERELILVPLTPGEQSAGSTP